MVRLYKEAFGRGPRRARASYAGTDSLVVLLERTLTTAERNLVALGEHRLLHEARMFIQSSLEPQAREVVEQALGRHTIAFATGLDAHSDVAAMFFTLGAPVGRSQHRPADDGG